jgi:hypothetical protein
MNSSPTPVPDTAQLLSAHVPAQQHNVATAQHVRLGLGMAFWSRQVLAAEKGQMTNKQIFQASITIAASAVANNS